MVWDLSSRYTTGQSGANRDRRTACTEFGQDGSLDFMILRRCERLVQAHQFPSVIDSNLTKASPARYQTHHCSSFNVPISRSSSSKVLDFPNSVAARGAGK